MSSTDKKWEVYFPDGAPYAGLRTEDGETVAGTSSGLSEDDAYAIVAYQTDSKTLLAMSELLRQERIKIEAAKQRELELLAVIERMCEVLAIVDDEYCFTNDERVNGALDLWPANPPRALREHEAKVLEEFAGSVPKDNDCYCADDARRMAEERRKK